jgi:protein CpxP
MQDKHTKVLKVVGVALAIALSVGAAGVLAQGPPQGGGGRGFGQGMGPGHGQGGRGMGPGMGRGPMGGPGGMGGPGQMGPGPIMQGLRELNLTDAQKEQVKGILEGHKAEFKKIADATQPARQALHEAVTADKFDEAAIRAAAAAVGAAEGDAAVLRARVHADVWALLTPEQQTKAKELKGQVGQRRGARLNQLRDRVQKFLNTVTSLL